MVSAFLSEASECNSTEVIYWRRFPACSNVCSAISKQNIAILSYEKLRTFSAGDLISGVFPMAFRILLGVSPKALFFAMFIVLSFAFRFFSMTLSASRCARSSRSLTWEKVLKVE